ncbi:dipeptidase PepE [Cryomorphaceae bacterium 1068]|nr:dipeptidase PepE [Cryomorphaceae bacterium 1068]
MAKQILLVSTSTVHGSPYLSYVMPDVVRFFSGCTNLLFIPYARPGGISIEEYSNAASKAFADAGISIKGIHNWNTPQKAIDECDGIFTGGGNTFLLLKTLQENGLVEPLRDKVLSGTPYMGTSAGSNIAGKTINNTNDMPIVYPQSFEALGLVPFNLNPHFLDPDPTSKHMGETRETRIKEFHTQSDIPVFGIREGSAIEIQDEEWKIIGEHTVRVFTKGKEPFETFEVQDLKDSL